MPALSGRRAWVTGASSGIGTATVADLARPSHTVTVCELLIRPQSQEL